MSMQSETFLVCPKCGEPIKLTESLAAPLVAATCAQYEQKLAQQSESFAAEKTVIATQQSRNEQRAAELEIDARKQNQAVAEAVRQQLEEQLTSERTRIAKEQSVIANKRVADDMKAQHDASDLQEERIEKLKKKLGASQAVEAGFLQKKRELDDRERGLSVQVQEGINAGLSKVRAQATSEAEAKSDLELKDSACIITTLHAQITTLQRKSAQGSQQTQGESMELVLEDQLRAQFPFDLIEAVAKGESGADILQCVRDNTGQLCGQILWESKRTKEWSDGWLKKLKVDQRRIHADLAIIVSQALPKHITLFDQLEGIWVSSRSCVLPVASALRISLMELTSLRRSGEGQESKAQQIYVYLTGPQFKQRVECIAEKFTELRKDLDTERKWMNKQWSKRDRELITVLEATSGMYGDLQGIAGKSLREIDALEGPMRLQLKS